MAAVPVLRRGARPTLARFPRHTAAFTKEPFAFMKINPESRYRPPLWKRALDLGLILAALPLIALIMGLISLFIKIVSPGRVLFVQERVGANGASFRCFKFRSMRDDPGNAEVHRQHLERLIREGSPMKKLDVEGDPRLIKFGGLLRATGLDELPQLFNVVRGEMSLVGPRPCMTYEYERYTDAQRERFAVLPGLTGLWQVSGKNTMSFEEMVETDIRYVKSCRPGGDLGILFKTFGAVLGQVLLYLQSRGSARRAVMSAR